MTDKTPLQQVETILRQFHRNSCYPEAMSFEVNAAADAILRLLTEPISDAGHTVADGLKAGLDQDAAKP